MSIFDPDDTNFLCPGAPRPGAAHSNATTYLTFERAELEETVRWIARSKSDKKGPKIPRRVSSALNAFSHMLNAYPDAEVFHISAPDDAGQPSGVVGTPSALQVNVTL